LLDCIKLSEYTLRAKEYDSPEEKFNQDFDEFISRLEHMPRNDRIEINPESLDLVNDQELIDYINSLDSPDGFDDLDDWTDDIDLFMQGLCNPHNIDDLWLQAKAKELCENFQWNYPNYQVLQETTLQLDDPIEFPH
jgi:hypothetical protein